MANLFVIFFYKIFNNFSHFKKVVGIAMIKKEFWDKKTPFELQIGDKKSKGIICDLPLV